MVNSAKSGMRAGSQGSDPMRQPREHVEAVQRGVEPAASHTVSPVVRSVVVSCVVFGGEDESPSLQPDDEVG